MPDPNNKKKKIVFDDTNSRHAQLRVRLEYDGLSQAGFFRSLVTGYLNKDEDILSYLNRYKLKHNKQSKKNIKKIDKDYEKSEDLLAKFGIKDEELESIFDIIEEEHPDL